MDHPPSSIQEVRNLERRGQISLKFVIFLDFLNGWSLYVPYIFEYSVSCPYKTYLLLIKKALTTKMRIKMTMTTDLNVNMVWNVTEKILSTETTTNIAGQRGRPKERPKKRLLKRKRPKMMMTSLILLLLMTVKMTSVTSLMTKNLLKNGLQMMMNDYE